MSFLLGYGLYVGVGLVGSLYIWAMRYDINYLTFFLLLLDSLLLGPFLILFLLLMKISNFGIFADGGLFYKGGNPTEILANEGYWNISWFDKTFIKQEWFWPRLKNNKR